MAVAALTQDDVKQLFTYKDGHLYWNQRLRSDFKSQAKHTFWNRHMVGKRVGGISSTNGYVELSINGNTYREHILIWLYHTGKHPVHTIDHVNHVKHDNRIENLRDVSTKEQNINRAPQKNNSSGYMGIRKTTDIKGKPWRVTVMVDKKHIHGGFFADIEDAVKARKALLAKHGFHKNHGLPLTEAETV